MRSRSCWARAGGRYRRVPLLEAEEEHQSLVHGAQLARTQPSGRPSESLRVDNRGLLDQDACLGASETDHRTEARRAGLCRGWSDEHGAEIEELVSLKNHRVASATLLVAAGAPRRWQPEDLTPDHSADRLGRKLCHLLPDDAHLLTVSLVSRERADLFADHGANPSTCSSLAQRSAYRF